MPEPPRGRSARYKADPGGPDARARAGPGVGQTGTGGRAVRPQLAREAWSTGAEVAGAPWQTRRPPPSPITVVRPDSVPSAGGSGPAGSLQLGRRLASPEASAGGGPAAGVSLCPSCRGATGMDQTFLARGSRHRK